MPCDCGGKPKGRCRQNNNCRKLRERLGFSIEFNDETGKITIFDGEDFICRGMRETLFLHLMENEPDTAMELAVKFDCLSHDRDAALSNESVDSMDENVSEIAGAIRQGDTGHLTAWIVSGKGNDAGEQREGA